MAYYLIAVDKTTRMVSATLDHFIMTLIFGVFALPEIIYHILKPPNSNNTGDYQHWSFYVIVLGYALYFFKDSFQGQSIAKRLLKLKVVNCETGEKANFLRCFLRNVFLILFPIEIVMIWASPSRRIGDLVAGTAVVPVNEN